jgi:hypothetical protein
MYGETAMMYVLLLFTAFAFVCSPLWTTMAQAANRFGVVCIHNKTNSTIRFRVKIGKTDRTQVYAMPPGHNRSFSHRYDEQDENKSPRLVISFDSDLRRGRGFTTTYRLPRKAAAGDSCAEGNQYAFEYEPSNRGFIDLKQVR